jgi:hypothetical protein
MCGVVDDVTSFIGDSVGEIFSHPLQALGAGLGIPGYDPFFGGLFNKDALISPTGNFTENAWQDMYNANPGDTGALDMFHGINSVADKIAPAVAGMYAGPLLSGASGMESASPAFTTGLEGASNAGALESGMGGAAMFGPSAGTGVTLAGSDAAGAMGAGGLGVAGGDALSGVSGTSGMFTGGGASSGLGGVGSTSPVASNTPMAAVSSNTPTGSAVSQMSQMTPGSGITGGETGLGQGGASMEGAQAAAAPGGGGGIQAATSGYGGAQTGLESGAPSNLSGMFGPDSGSATMGAQAAGSGAGSSGGSGGSFSMLGDNANMATDIPGQSIGADYGAAANSAEQGGGFLHTLGNLFGNVTQNGNNLGSLIKLINSGVNAFQQHGRQGAYNDYVNQINQLYSPNSPYAQQMMQTLARQDAAAGRNSQYGTRAAQLAANLTQDRARALTSAPYFQASTATPGNNMLNALFSNFGSPQGARELYNLGSAAFNGLSSLF